MPEVKHEVVRQSDGELLNLGAEFDTLMPKYVSLYELDGELGKQAHSLAWERAGRDETHEFPTNEEVERFLQELSRAEIETGWHTINQDFIGLLAKLEKIAAKIKDSSAHTILGLSIKTRVAAWIDELMGATASKQVRH